MGWKDAETSTCGSCEGGTARDARSLPQLCHGFRSSVLDEAFLPLPYGFPISHGLRPACPVDADPPGNVIDPSAPPNDSDGAAAEANGFSDGLGSLSERSPPDPLANGFDSTSLERNALEFEGSW